MPFSDEALKAHERALHQLLDGQLAAAGRAKADAFVIAKLIDALATSGLLDRGPFDRLLADAVTAARDVPAKDAATAAVWVAFADRIALILGDTAPEKPKGM